MNVLNVLKVPFVLDSPNFEQNHKYIVLISLLVLGLQCMCTIPCWKLASHPAVTELLTTAHIPYKANREA